MLNWLSKAQFVSKANNFLVIIQKVKIIPKKRSENYSLTVRQPVTNWDSPVCVCYVNYCFCILIGLPISSPQQGF